MRVCRAKLLRRRLIHRFHAVAQNRVRIRKNHFRVHSPNSLALLVVVFAQLLQLLNAIRLDRIHNLKNRVNHTFKSVLVPNFCSFFLNTKKLHTMHFFRKNFFKFYQYSLPENLILVHFKRKKMSDLSKIDMLER